MSAALPNAWANEAADDNDGPGRAVSMPQLLEMLKPHFPVGYQVAEDERSIVFVPKLGDVLVFAGVNVMDKSVTTVRPALPDDARLKLVDDAPAK